MSRPTFDHLRLVTADDFVAGPAETPFVADWSTLCHAFSRSTGLRLEFCPAGQPPSFDDPQWEQQVPAAGDFAPGKLCLAPVGKSRLSATRAEAAQQLAQSIGSLVTDLYEAHRALWQREAELATAVPVVIKPREESNQLASKFTAVLRAAAAAVGCQSAAMYLLDDDTRNLKLRAHWGLTHTRFAQPPRPLRGSRADLEALAGHAVTLTDVAESGEWNVPEPAPAAACVPISSATMPLGTLWVFCDRTREFTDAEVNLLEIIAGRLAAELEREVLLREQHAAGGGSQLEAAVRWQQALVPPPVENLEQWQLAARPSARGCLHGDVFHWQLDPQQRLHLTLATAHGQGVSAALSAARLAGVLQAPLDATRSPSGVLEQLDEALTRGSAGDEQATAFAAVLDEAHGEVAFAAAGQIDAFVVRPHGWEPIIEANGQPLGNLPQAFALGRALVEPGDLLVVLSGKPRRRPRLQREGMLDARYFAEAVLHHPHLKPAELATLLASLWEPGQTDWEFPPAVLIAKRRG